MATSILLRVVLSPTNVQKFKVDVTPDMTVDAFKVALETDLKKKSCNVPRQYVVQYFDDDFKQYVNITSVNDLTNLGTIMLVVNENEVPTDGASASAVVIPEVVSPNQRKSGIFSNPFNLPEFPATINLQLDKFQKEYEQGRNLNLTFGMKSKILELLGNEMYKIKLYPSDGDFEIVAKALIAQYPCLKSKTGVEGHEHWKASLKYKLGNLRSQLRFAGCTEALVNGGKRSKYQNDLPGPRKSLKKPRKGEANYSPDIPVGEDENSMETNKNELITMMRSANRNLVQLNKLMALTFATRRKMIIQTPSLPVKEIMNSWPALFTPSQVLAELSRITNVDGRALFYKNLDLLVPRLSELFRARSGKSAGYLKTQLEKLNTSILALDNPVGEADLRREYVLMCMPAYLQDEPDALFKIYPAETHDDDVRGDLPQHIAIIGHRKLLLVEKEIVLELDSLVEATLSFLSIHYALDLQYPNDIKHTMAFMQHMLLQIGTDVMPARLSTLKEKLAKMV